MEPSWRRWAVRVGAAALLAFTAAAMPYRLLGGPASDQVDRMAAELERTRAAARDRRGRIAELRREIEALRNQKGAIEEIARRELGMIMPGELVLRFEPGEPPAPASGASGAPAADRPGSAADQERAEPSASQPAAGGAP
jgi:cell division protein FtsB